MAANPRDPWIKPGTALAAPAPEDEDERDPWQKPGTTRTQGPPAAAPEPTERPGLFARALSRLNERPRPSTVEGLVGLQRFRGAATTGATDLGGTALVRPAPEAPAPLPPTDRDLAELPPGERAAVPERPQPEDGRRPIASFGDRVPTPRPTGPTHFADTGSLEELRRAQAQAGRTQDRYTETLAREEYLKGKTPGERLQNAAVSFARSGAEMPASMLSGIAVLAKELDEITGTGEYEGKDAKDLATARAAARIREWADEHLPDDPKMRGAFLEQVLPAAFGSGAFFLATGAAGRVVGASGGAVAGVTGALSEGGSVYEEARQMGASDRTARLAGLAAMPLGATEALPVERQLGRLFGEGGNRIFREAFYGGMEEGLQELGQGVGENIVAGQSYDPGRPVGQGVGTNAFAGFLTGGLLSAGATALSPSRERVVRRFRDELAAATDRYGPDLEGISKRDARRLGRMAAEAAVAAQQEGEPTPRPMDRGGRPIPGIQATEEAVAPVPASDEGAGVPEADPWQKPPEGAGRDNLERAPRAAQEAAGAPEAPAATEEAPVPDIAPQGEAEAGERAENESARTLGEWLDVATTPRQIQYVEEAIDEARVDGRITMEEAGRLNQQVARIKRGKPAPEAPAGPAIPGPRASSQTPAAAGRRERTITVAGNQRDMMEKRLRAEGGERWAAHERAMEGRAELFGLPPRPSPDAVVRRVMLDANGEPTAPVLALGREEQTVFPGSGEKAATAYAWVSLDETVPSHDPFSFERQPEEVYPSAIQGRAYHGERGRAARDDVIRLTGKFNSGIFLDATIMADGGVPVIAGQSYDPGRLRQLNSASDAPRGKTKDVLSDAATKAAQLRSAGRALQHFDATLGEDQTVRAYLETAAGRDFLAELVRDGVFTEGERARYVDVTTGTPTDEGKLVIERILRSAAIGDPDVVGRAPGSALRKLDSALPAIVQANQVEGWDLSPVLQEALDVLASARANGNTIEDQLGQGDLLGASVSEEAAAMARFLDGARKNEVTEAFRGYAEDAGAYRRQGQSEDMFGHRPKGPTENFRRRFGSGVRVESQSSSGRPSERTTPTATGAPSDSRFATRAPLEPGWSVAQLASERLPDAGRFSSRTETAEEEDVGRFAHREPAGLPGGFFDLHAVTEGIRGFFRRNFTSAGDLPRPVFERKIKRDGWMSSQLRQVAYTRHDFEATAREVFDARTLTEAQADAINAVLNGTADPSTLPEPLRPIVAQMRAELDALSHRLVDSGAVEGDLAARVKENMGTYLTRSYQVFDDPQWAEKVPQDVRNKAKALLRREFPGSGNAEVEGMLNELLFRGERDRPIGPIVALSRGSKLGSKDLSILQKRKDIAPEIRALWGEYTDPLVNYVRSVEKMTQLIANHEFLRDVKAAHRGEIVMGEALGEDAFLFDSPVVKNSQSYHARFAGEGSKTLEPLNGLYTTPEIRAAFEKAMAVEHSPDWLRLYMKANGTVKLAKTVGSLMTHIRNMVGNMGFAAANGHWRAGKGGVAWKTILTNITKKSNEEWRSYYRHLQELGVVDESARAGELLDVIRDASKRDMEKFGESRIQTTNRKVLGGATDLYRAEDDVWKVYAFENEVARYSKARGVPRAEVEEEAARIVRNTYPTYSLVPEFVKRLRRFPVVGTFASFPAEVIRTSYNTIELTATELRDPRLRKIGSERLAGLMVASFGVWAAGIASRILLGMTSDDDDDVRRFVAPWTKNSNIIYVGREDGKVQFIDFSYTDPHSYLRKPLIALMNGEDWRSAVYEAGVEALSPFLSEEILAGKLLDVSRNQKSTGGRVYNPQDPIDARTADIIGYVWDAVEPGTVSSMERILLGVTGRTTIHGRSYDPVIESAAVFTGHRLQELDVTQALSFKARDFKRGTSEAHRILTGIASRRGSVSENELREAYLASERSKKELLEDAHHDAAAALRLGLTSHEVRRVLEGSGLTNDEVRMVIQNRYRPYQPSGRFLASVSESVQSTKESPEEVREARRQFEERRRTILQLARDVRRNGLPPRQFDLHGKRSGAKADRWTDPNDAPLPPREVARRALAPPEQP